MKGKEIMHTQSKIILDPDQHETRTYHEYAKKLEEFEAFNSTREALRKSALIQKNYYDRKANLYQYKSSTAVWITNHAPPELHGFKKFTAKYLATFISSNSLIVQNSSTNTLDSLHYPYIEQLEWTRKIDVKIVVLRSKLTQCL